VARAIDLALARRQRDEQAHASRETSEDWTMTMIDYLHNLAIAIDQLFHALIGGHADETLSASAYRNRNKSKAWNWLYNTLNLIFFWEDNHCYLSYYNEINRKHLPEEYRHGRTD